MKSVLNEKGVFPQKHENFFWHTLIILENSTFPFITLFMRISQTWLESLWAHLFWPIFPHFFAFNGQKVLQILMYSQNRIKYQILFRSNVTIII